MLKIISRVNSENPKLKSTDVYLTRGDSAYITIYITDKDGNNIEINNGDIISIQVRDRPDGDVLFDGVIETDEENQFIWHIQPQDTKTADKDEYCWDAQIEFSNGDIFTFIPVSKFIILPEITKED